MILIGGFREFDPTNEALPFMRDSLHHPVAQKEKIVQYLKSGRIEAVAPAVLTDVIDYSPIDMELLFQTDGKFEWRSDLRYYVEKYDVELPDAFIQHVLSQKQN